MNESVSLVAEIRENFGTGAARAIRNQGKVPGIVYGSGKQPINIYVEEKEITKLYRKKHFIATVIDLKVGDTLYKVLPKTVDLHPITDIVQHFDFIYLADKVQKLQVPLVFEGKERAVGVKRGGFFNIIKRTLTILAPTNNIPQNITIEVSDMHIGQTIKASSIKLPDECSLINDKDFVVASITGRGGKAIAEEDQQAAQATAAPDKK